LRYHLRNPARLSPGSTSVEDGLSRGCSHGWGNDVTCDLSIFPLFHRTCHVKWILGYGLGWRPRPLIPIGLGRGPRENHGSRVRVIPGAGAGCEFVTRAKPTPAGKGRRGRRGFFLSLPNLRNLSVLRRHRLQVFLRRKVRCTDSCESPSCKSPPGARWPTQPTSFFMMAPLLCRHPEPPNFKTFQSLQTLELRPHILACPCHYFFLLTRSL
jgi:hypothetical protein